MRFAALALFLFGCNHGALEASTVEHDARFAGLWLVDQPTHALYEASLYDLRADGELAHVSSFGFGFAGEAPQTGIVGNGETSCVFGDRWRSKGPEILILDGDCSDGRAREITLGFFADAARNTSDAPVEILTVDGESGWRHIDWPWRFKKCVDGDYQCRVR